MLGIAGGAGAGAGMRGGRKLFQKATHEFVGRRQPKKIEEEGEKEEYPSHSWNAEDFSLEIFDITESNLVLKAKQAEKKAAKIQEFSQVDLFSRSLGVYLRDIKNEEFRNFLVERFSSPEVARRLNPQLLGTVLTWMVNSLGFDTEAKFRNKLKRIDENDELLQSSKVSLEAFRSFDKRGDTSPRIFLNALAYILWIMYRESGTLDSPKDEERYEGEEEKEEEEGEERNEEEEMEEEEYSLPLFNEDEEN